MMLLPCTVHTACEFVKNIRCDFSQQKREFSNGEQITLYLWTKPLKNLQEAAHIETDTLIGIHYILSF